MRPRTTALLALALVVPLVAPVAGSPQPRPICPVCGTGLEETVDGDLLATVGVDRPLNLSVSGGDVTIDVRTDGAAEWTVRNRLSDDSAVRYLREHPDRRHDVVAAALREGGPAWPSSVSDVRTRVDGQTLVVRFRHAEFADRRPGGVLFSDYFFVTDDRRLFSLTVDELTVRPPDGYAFTNRPDGPSTSAHEFTWTGEEYGPYITDVYLAMAPSEGPAASLATRAALAGATLPFVVSNLSYALPGTALFGALVWFLGRDRRLGGRGAAGGNAGSAGVDASDDDDSGIGGVVAARLGREGLARALLVGGLVLSLHPLYASVVPLLVDLNVPLLVLGLLYAAAGGLALWPRALGRGERSRRRTDGTPIRLLALPFAVVVLVAAGRYLVSPVGSEPVLAELGRQTLLAASALPAGLLLAYGHALERGASPRRWAAGVAATLLVLAVLRSGPFRPPGAFAGLVALVLLVGAVLSAVAGYPLFLLGRLMAGGEVVSGAGEADAPDG